VQAEEHREARQSGFAGTIIQTTDSRNNRVARCILCALGKHLSGRDFNVVCDAFTVEHVLPQKAPDGWGGINHDDAEALIFRLGNMTLLQAGANRDLGNHSYAHQRPVYRQSEFALTRKLAEDHAQGTAEWIAARQQWMAAQASSIWRIAPLG
jgi:hypothetical protein